MSLNIPESPLPRLVIIGAGFAGLKLASKLHQSDFQIVLIDKNNFHQFQPLFYQVATAGLEPSAISFPLRKVFQDSGKIHIRVTELLEVDIPGKTILTKLGKLEFDYLVLSTGVSTNFFGMKGIQEYSMPMKSVSEALSLRNHILQNYEDAVTCTNQIELDRMMNIVVVGGGPTGVEISGTLAEMKRNILPKDYPDLDFARMNIYLIEAGNRLLNGMDKISSTRSLLYLERLGVKVKLNAQVQDYDGSFVKTSDGGIIPTRTLVWAAGVIGKPIPGFSPEQMAKGTRIKVNAYNQVEDSPSIFALGDIAFMETKDYPFGHPQLAQAAIQQATLLAKNLNRIKQGKTLIPFIYRDKGSMATVGRNLAVVDLPHLKFHGFLAWLTWMFVHLMAIVGVKNRVLIFINWFWNYITYDQSLRLIINPHKKNVSN